MLGRHLGSGGIGTKSDHKRRGFLLLLFLSWTFQVEAAFNVLVCRTGNLIFQCDNTFFDINRYSWIFNDTFIFKALHQHWWINYSFFWLCVKKKTLQSLILSPWNWGSPPFKCCFPAPKGENKLHLFFFKTKRIQ